MKAPGVRELLVAYRRRELSPVEMAERSLRMADAIAPLNAFTALGPERALAAATRSEAAFRRGRPRALEGVPVAIKDLIDTAELTTAYGSRMFRDHVPSRDATAVRLLRDAGAIVIGKTATHEFAWGISCENPHFGDTRNPWNPHLIAGGSSGGSAVAVAAGVVPIALGTDTGGSIRIPASFCGAVGLKPSYDAVPGDGVFPLAPSLDHVGPMGRRPSDVLAALDVLVESRDDAPAQTTFRFACLPTLAGLEPEPRIGELVEDAAAMLAELGGTRTVLALHLDPEVARVFAIIQQHEALQVHRRRGLFPDREAEYGSDVAERLRQAESIEPEQVAAATAARACLFQAMEVAFEHVEVLLTPVSLGPPKPIGRGPAVVHRGREVAFRAVAMANTIPLNLSGLPAVAVRGGFDENGVPVGVQLIAARGRDRFLLTVAQRLYDATLTLQEREPPATAVTST